MQYIPRLPEKNVNVTPTSPLRDLLVMLGGSMLVLALVYIALGVAVDLLVPQITPEMEAQFSGYFSSMRPGGEVKDDASKPLQQLADRIQQQCVDLPYSLNVEVVDDQTVNALAMPGGNVVIFSGLLEAAESENELAFVLAHEMGHFVNRDHLTSMGRGLVFVVLSSAVFGSDSVIGKRVGEMLMLSELGFSRQHETMADTFALQTVNCFYGHVAGSTSFFEHTGEMAEERFAGHYLSSHPLHLQRVTELKKLAVEQGFRTEGELKPVGPFKPPPGQSEVEPEPAEEGILNP